MATETQLEAFIGGRVRVLLGNIIEQEVDAIVNAANSTLLGGGGVDGAIHRAGGPLILKQCREIRRLLYPNGLPAGESVITSAGELPAQNVIHTVGPIYGRHQGQESTVLSACYKSAMSLALSHSLHSIAFPAISTGAYGYPRDEAAAVASRSIQEFLNVDDSIKDVRLVFFQQRDLQVFLANQEFQ
ncbi:MAG: Appr-p processing [Acidobacteria bacterium]|nr:Appr-p processing [Acidobacteriota bacterium]